MEIATPYSDVNTEAVQSMYAPSDSSLVLVVVNELTLASLEGVYAESMTQPPGQTQLYGLTNSSGMVSFSNLTVGYYSLLLSRYLFFNETFSVYVGSGASIVDTAYMYPTQFGNLVVRVISSEDGAGLVGASVASSSQPLHQLGVSATTASLGYAFFDRILVGNYTFVAFLDGYSTQTFFVNIAENATTNEVVTLAKPSLITLVAVGPVIIAIAAACAIFLSLAIVRRRRRPRFSSAQETSSRIAPEPETHVSYSERSRPNRPSSTPAGAAAYREPNSEATKRFKSSMRPNVLLTSGSCPYCGSKIKVADAEFCWKCGGNLTATNVPLRRSQIRETLAGHCIVCNLHIVPSDTIVSCPHCRNVAHKTHMLEWLHVKGQCPVCGKHLDTKDLIE